MNEKRNVVNFFAGPGAGKSTMALLVTGLLKMDGINTDYIPKYAKSIACERRPSKFEVQENIFGMQSLALSRAADECSVVVTDSPLLLSALYSSYGERWRSKVEISMSQLAQVRFHTYNNLNFLIRRTKPYNPSGRLQTEAEVHELDRLTSLMLYELEIPFQTVECSETSARDIVECIKLNFGL